MRASNPTGLKRIGVRGTGDATRALFYPRHPPNHNHRLAGVLTLAVRANRTGHREPGKALPCCRAQLWGREVRAGQRGPRWASSLTFRAVSAASRATDGATADGLT